MKTLCCIPLIHTAFEIQSNFWMTLAFESSKSFKRGSLQTLIICPPHFEQRMKKYQGDFPQAPKAANSWNDWMKRHGLDPIQKMVGLKAAAAADKANKPSLPTTLLNCSPAHNKHWHDRFEHNWTRNWLDLQLSDNTPGGEMKSWKVTLGNFVNHYSETWPGSHLLAPQAWPNITSGEHEHKRRKLVLSIQQNFPKMIMQLWEIYEMEFSDWWWE